MAYTKTTWINGSPPALNSTNLNHIEQGIKDAHDLVTALQNAVGSPLVASTVAEMTDTTHIYVYTGSETGYTAGNWYYYDGDSWESGGVYNSVAVQTDTTLSQTGQAADAKATGDALVAIQSQINGGIPYDIKTALDNIIQNVAFKNDDVYSTDLAAIHSWATSVNLVSISAVFTQGQNVIYDTDSLDVLKQYLVVTASYDNSTTSVLDGSAYTLSGTLEVGTSTITVTYEGKTATFTVTVADGRRVPTEYTWLYEAKDGELLSEQNYVTVSGVGTETINENGELVLHCANNGSSSSSTSVLYSFSLTDTTTSNAVLSARAKLIDLVNMASNNTPIGQRLQLSNGSSGCSVYLGKKSSGTKICVQYYEGSTYKTVDTNFAINEYHIFEVKLQNGTQSFSIDSTEIFSTSTLSTSYTSNNVIRLQATSTTRTPNGLTTAFDWIAYYEQ